MKYKLNGQWYEIAVPSYDSLPVGAIISYAGENIPTGYILCNGQSLLRTEYSDLFNAIGTTYGSVDSTHFNLPNIKGRVLVGLDSTQTEFDTLGETGGSKYLQAHSHKTTTDTYAKALSTVTQDATAALSQGNAGYWRNANLSSNNTSTTGTGDSGNLPPYIVVNYIIKAHPSAVNTSEVVNEYSESETNVYSANYVNNNFQLVGEVLYSNSTGTTGDVILSKNVSNYSYIEILYKNVDACFNSVKVDEPNGKVVSLISVVSFTGGSGASGLIAVHNRDVTISGTSISTLSSTNNGNYYGALALWDGQNASLDKTNYIYITKVIGYK